MKRLVRFVVARILPRSRRQEYMDALDERCSSLSQWIPESLLDLGRFYRISAIAAFDKTLVWAQVAAGLFCFAAAWPLPAALAIVLGTMLGALTVRDAYTHPHSGSYLHSAGDAPAAGHYSCPKR